jgi:ubiquitin carboxyl-terminal hydrolase 8
LWRFAPQFQGFEQQDSQEVLTFFLDQLHEDLNLVKVKPDSQLSDKEELALETMPPLLASQEEWERGLLRDNSVISRLFHGQESSRLRCLTCQAVRSGRQAGSRLTKCAQTSTTWSSYNMLSLKIPAAKRKKGNAFTIEDLLRDYTKSEMMPEE